MANWESFVVKMRHAEISIMKFIFHVFKKTALFVSVYDSEPMEANECRRQANLKRKEYGSEYDVYYTIVKEEDEDEK